MKNVLAAASILMALTACGNKSTDNKSQVKTVKSDYACSGFSTLDSQAQPSTANWFENFDFKGSETSVSKNVGVTSGDAYAITVGRETNSEGDRINLAIMNLVTKSVSVAQVEEGAKAPMISISPDGKFQVAIVCHKK
jgi:hypothetical protein